MEDLTEKELEEDRQFMDTKLDSIEDGQAEKRRMALYGHWRHETRTMVRYGKSLNIKSLESAINYGKISL